LSFKSPILAKSLSDLFAPVPWGFELLRESL
jgi:hypothetical protein